MQFKTGDRVVCSGTSTGARVGFTARVLSVDEEYVLVKFDRDDKMLSLYPHRLSLEDPLISVCSKVKEMEKRWKIKCQPTL